MSAIGEMRGAWAAIDAIQQRLSDKTLTAEQRKQLGRELSDRGRVHSLQNPNA